LRTSQNSACRNPKNERRSRIARVVRRPAAVSPNHGCAIGRLPLYLRSRTGDGARLARGRLWYTGYGKLRAPVNSHFVRSQFMNRVWIGESIQTVAESRYRLVNTKPDLCTVGFLFRPSSCATSQCNSIASSPSASLVGAPARFCRACRSPAAERLSASLQNSSSG
jgi:hypothetical protein